MYLSTRLLPAGTEFPRTQCGVSERCSFAFSSGVLCLGSILHARANTQTIFPSIVDVLGRTQEIKEMYQLLLPPEVLKAVVGN